MGFLVGMMLLHMSAEDSFWLLVSTIENFAKGFFNPSLSQIKIDATVFEILLKKKINSISKQMIKTEIPSILYITQWFITFFTGPLPWESTLRVWDMFYCDGPKAFFRAALGILKCCQSILI